MTYNFGQSISREFYALADDDYINLPSQAPTLYLFSTLPSMVAARAGTGASSSLSYWTHSDAEPFKRTYTWPAVDDPAPTSSVSNRGYWEAINYVINNSGQKITEIRPLTIQRAETHDSTVTTDADLVRSLWSPINTYYPKDAQLETFIDLAIDHFKLDLLKRNLVWGKVQNLKEIRIPIAYKTLVLAMRGQVGRREGIADLVAEWEAEYQAYSATIKLPYDQDNDGNTVEVEASSQAIRIQR